jgi:hypothetical protein
MNFCLVSQRFDRFSYPVPGTVWDAADFLEVTACIPLLLAKVPPVRTSWARLA